MHFRRMEPPPDEVFSNQGGAAPFDLTMDINAGYTDPFHDVFGEDISTPRDSEADHESHDGDMAIPYDALDHFAVHPSDVPRLRAEHNTAGYREGISAGKEKTVQKGFDEGFSLGATIGLEAGRLLGTLEGIEGAVGEQDEESKARARNLLKSAREELSAGRIFAAEYWGPEGGWTYDVRPADHVAGDEEDVTFADVASWHPLIRKWAHAVAEEAAFWNVDVHLVVPEDEEDVLSSIHLTEGQSSKLRVEASSKKSLDW